MDEVAVRELMLAMNLLIEFDKATTKLRMQHVVVSVEGVDVGYVEWSENTDSYEFFPT